MVELENASRRRPKPDGSAGYIISPDPDQKSFRQAIICIVFTGMWLESLVHLIMIEQFGEIDARKWDRRSYSEKCKKLGCTDKSILDQVQTFSDSRNDVMHEKAYWNQGSYTTAQDEAMRAMAFMKLIDSFLAAIKTGHQCIFPGGPTYPADP